MRNTIVGLAALAAWAGMAAGRVAAEDAANEAARAITADGLIGHIRVLASDEFEGRAPGSVGEERTVGYLIDQFRTIGLKPGNPDGTFVQEVPLVGFRVTSADGSFRSGGRTIGLKFRDDWIAVSRRGAEQVEVEDSDVVFVGYGVVAPEYGWDDYKGLDVRGKTIVMLVNDPPVPDPEDPSRLDPEVFRGRAMTYYGRWTYKYEIASEKGAAAAVIVHETGPAGYPFEVVTGSWSRENFDIRRRGRETGRVAVESWISLETARRPVRGGRARLRRPQGLGPSPRTSGRSRSARPRGSSSKCALRDVRSRNVLARLEGSDPGRKDEHVIYTAHWDHLGMDTSLKGDQTFNGAADNASGVAALLEIARAFGRLRPPPPRSILFLAVTAEEKGLLGAKFYAEHPLYPLDRTLADINMDVINLWGRTEDIVSVGLGSSTLDDTLVEARRRRRAGRSCPTPSPRRGCTTAPTTSSSPSRACRRSTPRPGRATSAGPTTTASRKRDEYTRNDYHKVSDEVKPDWDLSGAVEDARLLFELGDRVARDERYPEWKPGNEFRARREAMLKATRP